MEKWLIRCCFLLALASFATADEISDAEIESMLRNFLTPQDNPSLQLQALRRDLLKKLHSRLANIEENPENYDFETFTTSNNLAYNKRNLEALARAGYIKTIPPEEESNNDSNYKRSIANLAKNGQLPTHHDNDKRGIESLARNGELLHTRKEIQDLLDEFYSKRNIGSLARNYNFPEFGKRSLSSLAKSGDLNGYYARMFKRNLASLARSGMIGKRNVAALLRQDNYMNGPVYEEPKTERPGGDKRNIASVKAQYTGRRKKREVDYFDEDSMEYSSPVYQNNYDYEELLKQLEEYGTPEKRFLGRLPQMGKPKSTPSPKTRRYN